MKINFSSDMFTYLLEEANRQGISVATLITKFIEYNKNSHEGVQNEDKTGEWVSTYTERDSHIN